MASGFMTIDSFLSPWQTQFNAYARAFGVEPQIPAAESPLRQAAERVFAAAYNKEPLSDERQQGLLEDLAFLVELAAPRDENEKPIVRMIPGEFWNTFAGRTILILSERLMGDQFVDMAQAANLLGIKSVDLYALASTYRVSSYEDWRDRTPGKRRRFYMPQLKVEYENLPKDPRRGPR